MYWSVTYVAESLTRDAALRQWQWLAARVKYSPPPSRSNEALHIIINCYYFTRYRCPFSIRSIQRVIEQDFFGGLFPALLFLVSS